MLATMIEEAVNGWILTTWPDGDRFIYETYDDAQAAREQFERAQQTREDLCKETL